MTRQDESGVVLVNVLVVLALAAAMVTLMLTSQEEGLDAARRASAASQAEALAMGAEASVAAALARDKLEAPEADHLAEPWAAVAQAPVTLATGRFAVTVADAQGRYDLNRLGPSRLGELQVVARLLAALDLPAEIGPRIAARIARDGPLGDLSDLGALGLDATTVEALRPHVDALPPEDGLAVLLSTNAGRTLNLNSASPLLLSVVLGNEAAARRLTGIRDRQGSLTPADLARAGIVAPPGVGFTSDVFDVAASAETDGMRVELRSRLVRTGSEGAVNVASRRFGPAWADRPEPLA